MNIRQVAPSALPPLLALTSLCWAAGTAPPVDNSPLASYFDNSLVCEDQSTRATCRLWLYRDGSYRAFFAVAAPPAAPDIHGPFRINGREGTYTLREDGSRHQLCLFAGAPRVLLSAERQQVLFAESRCYPVEAHRVGDRWTQADALGHRYRLWLLEGR
jgi:hypothetical protein